MAVKRLPLHATIEVDTTAKTVTVVFQVAAADGEGDVDLHRIPIDLSGTANAEKRRKLRAVFAE